MAIFAYTARVSGVLKIGEVEAASMVSARRAIRRRHKDEGAVEVGMLFRPPPKIGTPREIPTMPSPRLNYHRDIYEPRLRKERAIPVHR